VCFLNIGEGTKGTVDLQLWSVFLLHLVEIPDLQNMGFNLISFSTKFWLDYKWSKDLKGHFALDIQSKQMLFTKFGGKSSARH
jgi:hypothetical protein